MASKQDAPSDNLDSSVVEVPEDSLRYVKSSIIDYINKATPDEFSAKIRYATGQPPKLEVTFGGHQQKQALSRTTTSKAIIVKNLPASADEELLEVFFESTKKQGGGPVKSVKLFGDKQDEQVACVEFCNSSAVETVLKKRPIKLGKIELDVQPFEPLLQGSEKIRDVQVNLTELLDKFTDDLLQKQAEGHPPEPEPPGPGPFEMFEMLKIGSRVTLNRSNDWYISLLEYRGHGRKGWVSKIKENRTVVVTLDNGETNCYCLGKDGNYRLKYGS